MSRYLSFIALFFSLSAVAGHNPRGGNDTLALKAPIIVNFAGAKFGLDFAKFYDFVQAKNGYVFNKSKFDLLWPWELNGITGFKFASGFQFPAFIAAKSFPRAEMIFTIARLENAGAGANFVFGNSVYGNMILNNSFQNIFGAKYNAQAKFEFAGFGIREVFGHNSTN